MARDFNGTNQKGSFGAAPRTIWPADGTLSYWAWNDNAHNSGVADGHFDATAITGLGLVHYVDNNIYAGWNTSGGGDDRVVVAASASNWPQGAWTHYGLTWVIGGTTTLFVNGSSVGTQGATNPSNDGGTFEIGHFNFLNTFFNGRLAEFGLWSAALTAAEVAVLAKGFAPSLVRCGSLMSHIPMIGRNSPEIDLLGRYPLTLTNAPTVTEHPRIIMPGSRQGIFVPAAGGGGGAIVPWHLLREAAA